MIVTVAVPTPLRRLFDYLPPADGAIPAPGVRVRVPFGNRNAVGLVVGQQSDSQHPTGKLKAVAEVIDDTPIVGEDMLDLLLWAAGYYQHPVGDALFSALPTLLRKGEPLPELRREYWQLSSHGLGLGEKSLARAKKQQGLVALLRQRGAVCPQELAAEGFTRQVINSVKEKGLIEPVLREPPAPGDDLLAEAPLPLRDEQARALAKIDTAGFSPTVIFGATGTGKTEVYLQAIQQVLARGRQALVLVPEINLTPQTLARFRRRFNGAIRAIHSGLSDRERLAAWHEAASGRADIVIGTRSAVFTPLARPGIIVVDEEHDPSFKQQEGFRYSARDIAVMRASRERIPVVLGSATPALETLNNCHGGRYQMATLVQRPTSRAPAWRTVDLRGSALQGGLSTTAINAIGHHLGAGNQVLVFLNRRGYAPLMLCHDCGWQGECRHCSTRLTAHLQSNRLICHHCEWQRPIPVTCPQCHSHHLQFSGQGTERCEETLRQLFSGTRVVRVDRDSTRRKGAMEKAIDSIREGDPCILLGTQMLAKGHHFPQVTLAVLVDVDSGLFSPDFRAMERTAQMIVQVAGRAGRGDRAGEICLQSHYCDHPMIAAITGGGYQQFAAATLKERRVMGLPPFSFQALFRADAREPAAAEAFLAEVRRRAQAILPPGPGVTYLGPLPGSIEKRRNHYRFTLLINGVNRMQLGRALATLCEHLDQQRAPSGVKWSLDVDPQEMS